MSHEVTQPLQHMPRTGRSRPVSQQRWATSRTMRSLVLPSQYMVHFPLSICTPGLKLNCTKSSSCTSTDWMARYGTVSLSSCTQHGYRPHRGSAGGAWWALMRITKVVVKRRE